MKPRSHSETRPVRGSMFARRHAALFAAALALSGAAGLHATDLPPGRCTALELEGEAFRVASEDTTFRKSAPDAAVFANGTAIVVWESFFTTVGSDDDRYSVHGRLFDEDGTPLGPQFQINTQELDEQRYATVGAAADGRFAVVWRSGTNLSGPKEIRARVYRANGLPLGPDFQVNSLVPNDTRNSLQVFPQVAMAPSGKFLVVWESDSSAGSDQSNFSIQARLFNADGTPAGPQFQVNQTTQSLQDRPDVAARPDGSFLVTWDSLTDATGAGRQVIQARVVSANGTPLGNDIQVNQVTGGSRGLAKVASGPGGQSLVVWQARNSSGSDTDLTSIEAQAISRDGSLLGPQFQVNQTTARAQEAPNVSAGPNGDFVVIWKSDVSSGSDDDQAILARHIAAPGRFFNVEFQVNTEEVGLQQEPVIALGPKNALAVYFSNTIDDQIEQEVMAQRLRGTASANSLCLNNRRFLVEVDWRNFEDEVGEGTAVPGGSDDSGLFWFFGPNNWEMLVKVLNGCPLNQRFWVFAAATTTVEYNLRVTDLFTGEQVSYQNPLGNPSAAVTDSGAFATCDVAARNLGLSDLQSPNSLPGWSTPTIPVRRFEDDHLASAAENLCAAGDESLCLQENRFEITVDYRTPQGETGQAKRVPFGSADSGLFWFFQADNWEMLVKVLNGCPLNQRFWVFAAATTDVEYTLTVRDTESGEVVEYFNPLGTAAAAIDDTSAFATCP